jgi:hypothetical protein
MTSPAEPIDLPQSTIDALKARQIAYIEARLVSPKAEAEWRANAASVYRELLAAPLSALIDSRALADALDAALSSEAVRATARPLVKAALKVARAELLKSRAKLGDYVPAASREPLDALVSRPKLFPERLTREIIKHEAVQEGARNVLYETLKEFSEKVNPFFADWGLPALLRRLSPFGLGGMKKGLESFRAEFDRRLEPEIRKFIHGFAGKGLRDATDQMIAQSDEPKAVDVRRHLVAWLLEQEIADLARSLDDEGAALAEDIGLDVVAHALSMHEVRDRRRALIEQAVEANKDRPLREVLHGLGATPPPDVDAAARATWPVVRAVLGAPAVRAWFAAMISEFFDEATKSA